MNKYEIRTNKKKEAIIESALNLFREKGYTDSSITEIAAMAHVSAVSIYNYFGSKENLVKECVRKLMGENVKQMNDILMEQGTFKDKLSRAVSNCSESPAKLLDEYFTSDAINDKVFVELFAESINEIRIDMFKAFIESGKSEGVIDASISTETIMEFLNGVMEIQASWQTQEEHRTKASELYKLVLYGLIGSSE